MLAHARRAPPHPALDALRARLMLGPLAQIADLTGAAPPPPLKGLDLWIDADGLSRLSDGAYRAAFLAAAPAWAILGGLAPTFSPPPLYRVLERHGWPRETSAGLAMDQFLILQRRN